MGRAKVVPEVRLLGAVRVTAWRGGGYVLGEVYTRKRRGKVGEETVRPEYQSNPALAVILALGRAQALLATGGGQGPAKALLDAMAGLISGNTGEALRDVPTLVRAAREAAGLSKAALARRAGCSRTTVKDVEAGRVAPQVTTVTRLLAACQRGK